MARKPAIKPTSKTAAKKIAAKAVKAEAPDIENEGDAAETDGDEDDQIEAPEGEAPPETPAAEDQPVPASASADKPARTRRRLPVEFDAEGLVGQLTDAMIEEVRDVRDDRPWQKLPQREQEQVIERLGKRAAHFVGLVVEAVRSRGHDHMSGKLESSGAFKDGFMVLKVKLPMSVENLELLSREGNDVQIVFANIAEFAGAPKTRAMLDEPTLLDEDEDEAYDAETGEIIEQPRRNGGGLTAAQIAEQDAHGEDDGDADEADEDANPVADAPPIEKSVEENAARRAP